MHVQVVSVIQVRGLVGKQHPAFVAVQSGKHPGGDHDASGNEARYRAGSAGAVPMVAVLRRADRDYAVPIDWQVSSPAVRPAPGRSLAPYVDGAALLLLELGVVVCAWWLVRGPGGSR